MIVHFGNRELIQRQYEYLQILSADTQRVLGSTDTVFTCDGSSSTFRVMFKEPVEILPCVHYIAAVTLKVHYSVCNYLIARA